MATLRMTLIVDYNTGTNAEEDQNAYGTTDPVEMAAIDQETGPVLMMECTLGMGEGEVVKWSIEPAEDGQ